jgi:hypothetical protein
MTRSDPKRSRGAISERDLSRALRAPSLAWPGEALGGFSSSSESMKGYRHAMYVHEGLSEARVTNTSFVTLWLREGEVLLCVTAGTRHLIDKPHQATVP